MGKQWKLPDFIFLGSKITADGDCSHEIKRCFLLGRKVMTNLDSILKSRDITLPTKIYIVKAMLLPVVMYRCESWTIKKAEHQRIDAFKLWCWRRLLRVLWIAKRSNQSIVKEINHEYLLEGLMLKLKLQYFGHLMGRADSLEKTQWWKRLRARGEGAAENEMVGWHHWFNGCGSEHTLEDSEGQWTLDTRRLEGQCCSPQSHKESDMTERLNNNTCRTKRYFYCISMVLEFCWGRNSEVKKTP